MNDFLNLMLDPTTGGGGIGSGGNALGFQPEQDPTLPSEIALAYSQMLTKAPPKPQSFDQRWTAWGSAFGGNNHTDGDPAVGSKTASTGKQLRLCRRHGLPLSRQIPFSALRWPAAAPIGVGLKLKSRHRPKRGVPGRHLRQDPLGPGLSFPPHWPSPITGSPPIAPRRLATSYKRSSTGKATAAKSKPVIATVFRTTGTSLG